MMRFYNRTHRFYAGIDLHATTISVCVLDAAGKRIDLIVARLAGQVVRPLVAGHWGLTLAIDDTPAPRYDDWLATGL